MVVLSATAIVGRCTETKGAVYWTKALFRTCSVIIDQSLGRVNAMSPAIKAMAYRQSSSLVWQNNINARSSLPRMNAGTRNLT